MLQLSSVFFIEKAFGTRVLKLTVAKVAWCTPSACLYDLTKKLLPMLCTLAHMGIYGTKHVCTLGIDRKLGGQQYCK